MLTKTSREFPPALTRARCLLPVRGCGAIRTEAHTVGCMCRNLTGCLASMAMQGSLVWLPNCLRRSRSIEDIGSSTALRSEHMRCDALTISQLSSADTVTQRSGPNNRPHPPFSLASSACSASTELCCTTWVPRPDAGRTTARLAGGRFRPSRTGSHLAYRGPTSAKTYPTFRARQTPVDSLDAVCGMTGRCRNEVLERLKYYPKTSRIPSNVRARSQPAGVTGA